MFDPKMKWVSFNQLFIFPVIVLVLVTSLAIAQDAELEEVLLQESSSIEMPPVETNVAEKEIAGSPSGIQASDAALGQQADMEAAGQVVGMTRENVPNEPLFGMATSLVPLVAIISGLIVGLALIRFLFRWRELVHQEHLLAIEKGLLRFQMNRKRLMLWGMVWMSLGIAVGVALWVNFDWLNAMWSLMPLLLGIVLLIYVGLIEKKRPGVQAAQISSTT